jgi:hypothetical protein
MAPLKGLLKDAQLSAAQYRMYGPNQPPRTSGPYSLLASTPFHASVGAWAAIAAIAVILFTLASRKFSNRTKSQVDGSDSGDALIFPFIATGGLIQLKSYDNSVFLPAIAVILYHRWRALPLYAPGLIAVWRPENVAGRLDRLTHGAFHLSEAHLTTLGGLYLTAAVLLHAATLWIRSRGSRPEGTDMPPHENG